jgi:hypothetical protein
MDDTMSMFLWKGHKLVSILIVCLLQQKGLCDKLLSNNVKFKLQSNIQFWDVYTRSIHVLETHCWIQVKNIVKSWMKKTQDFIVKYD